MDAVPEAMILLIVSVFFGDLILAAIGFGIGDGFISIGPTVNALVTFVAVAFVLSRLVNACNEFKQQRRENERVERGRFTQRGPPPATR